MHSHSGGCRWVAGIEAADELDEQDDEDDEKDGTPSSDVHDALSESDPDDESTTERTTPKPENDTPKSETRKGPKDSAPVKRAGRDTE